MNRPATSPLARSLGLLSLAATVAGLALVAPACAKQDSPKAPPTAVPPADEGAPAGEVAAAPTEPTGTDEAPAEPTAAAPGADGPAEGCKAYGDRLCVELGDGSETCNAARTITDLLPAAACAAGMAEIDFTVAKIKQLRQVCTTLVERLCADLGEATETCAMVRRETPSFPPERCSELLQNFDAVIADLRRMEARNQPLDADKIAKLNAGPVASFGPEDAKVTIVEFSDFECPYCTQAAAAVDQVKAKYADRVRIVFRHFPLNFHPNAHLASQAALAAGKQGKFWEFHDLLFKNQRAMERSDLEQHATTLGLDLAAFKADLDSGAFKAQVDADMKLGEEVAVDGTPTMFINGKRVGNPTDFAAISAMIEAELGQ